MDNRRTHSDFSFLHCLIQLPEIHLNGKGNGQGDASTPYIFVISGIPYKQYIYFMPNISNQESVLIVKEGPNKFFSVCGWLYNVKQTRRLYKCQ